VQVSEDYSFVALLDEGQLGRRSNDLGMGVHFLYNRFGIFVAHKGVTADLPAQASPQTPVKPSIFRVEY
jgi:hypothetical protein